jgi:hypothetical protein
MKVGFGRRHGDLQLQPMIPQNKLISEPALLFIASFSIHYASGCCLSQRQNLTCLVFNLPAAHVRIPLKDDWLSIIAQEARASRNIDVYYLLHEEQLSP